MGRRATGPAPLLLFPADREAAEAETQRLAAELVQHDRMRVHEADLSPPDMAGQSCWAIETVIGGRWENKGPARVLDPTCGAGIFPAAARLTTASAVNIREPVDVAAQLTNMLETALQEAKALQAILDRGNS